MPIRQTETGFDVYTEFVDRSEGTVRIQESSSAEEPRVWIFVGQHPDWGSAELNMEQADKIIAALTEWKSAHTPQLTVSVSEEVANIVGTLNSLIEGMQECSQEHPGDPFALKMDMVKAMIGMKQFLDEELRKFNLADFL